MDNKDEPVKGMEYPLRQFKLSSGDEIVCEVIQWQNEDELELVVRKPMRIGFTEFIGGMKYYSFRPWMIYQETDTELMVLNANHVVGIAQPQETLVWQYNQAVKDMLKMHEKRMEEFAESNPEEWSKQKGLTEVSEELLRQVQEMEKYLKEEEYTGDSDGGGSNILIFDPSKKKIIH